MAQLQRRRQENAMNPWRMLDSLTQDFFEDGWGFPRLPSTLAQSKFDFTPACNVKEDEKGYAITADLPGMKKEEIILKIDSGRLVMEGERKEEKEEEGEKFHRMERRVGKFVRYFEMPENADIDSLKASFKDGVLTVRVDKKVKQQDHARHINID